MEIVILGCGPSSGVPFYGDRWGACDPKNIKNIRTRSSILIKHQGATLLVDTGPDLRQQLVREKITDIDGVLYTHDHADHTHGIDDLRGLATLNNKSYPFWADEKTYSSLSTRFAYLMTTSPSHETFRPFMEPHLIGGMFTVCGISIIPFEQDHGFSKSLGFRMGDFAYSTDVVNLDERAFDLLKGVKVWIVGALQYEPHAAHAHLDKTLSWIDRVAPEKAYLTHMSGRLDYDILTSTLPPNVLPCYDGLRIQVS